jgi:hypothetical protein
MPKRSREKDAHRAPYEADFAAELARVRALQEEEARRRGVPVEQVAADARARAQAATGEFEAYLAAQSAERDEKRRRRARAIAEGALWLMFFVGVVGGLVGTAAVSKQAGGVYFVGFMLVYTGGQIGGLLGMLVMGAGLLTMLGTGLFALVVWLM